MENNKHRFNLEEIVLDETRHGFGPVDFPFEIVHGVKPIQDLAGCEASELLRNVFILQNMNHPVLRVDPHTFCQSWVLAWLRPKFVFRGLIACPREEYGLVQLTVEVGDAMNRKSNGAFEDGGLFSDL
uniref:Uncharacterized protein n=1 Tax=Caenorhabditis japonica TaxID=281687 RepID=A0A8R1EVD5_CAEJA